jgi:hypothetical protein
LQKRHALASLQRLSSAQTLGPVAGVRFGLDGACCKHDQQSTCAQVEVNASPRRAFPHALALILWTGGAGMGA